MSLHSCLGPSLHFRIRCRAFVSLLVVAALAWSSPIFGSEIHDAAKNGELARVKALLKENPELVSSKDEFGWTPLHLAAANGHKGVAEFLLANKADVNGKSNDGDTPLHAAARSGQKDLAEFLLANKAEVNATNKDGMTPLHLAAREGNKDVAEVLVAAKADIDARDGEGSTPLHWAASQGYKNVVQLLLAGKTDVNASDNLGNTPLHYAMLNGYKGVSDLLLANRADPGAKNNRGQTPQEMAALHGVKQEVVAGCLSKSASGKDFKLINAKHPKGVLVTSHDELSTHVGHTVTLAGTWGMFPKESGGTLVIGKGGQATVSNMIQVFTANSVTSVGGPCAGGGALKKSGTPPGTQ